jgi:DNA-binding transcriptional regulator PaaX
VRQTRISQSTGQIDSERGRGAYSSAEKTYQQFNDTENQIQRNVQFTEDERQYRLRVAQEEHAQRMRHQETEHQLLMQIWSNNVISSQAVNSVLVRLASNGASDDQVNIGNVVEQIAAIMSKTTDLTPPAATK